MNDMSNKIKVGVLTLSDGRHYLHRELLPVNQRYQDELTAALEATGEVEVVAGNEIIGSNEVAKKEAMRLKKAGVEMTIFNYAIWCYPQFTAVASNFAPGPYLLFCNLHPSECGMVGMLAAAGTTSVIRLKLLSIETIPPIHNILINYPVTSLSHYLQGHF
jgi:L-fucose isomerase